MWNMPNEKELENVPAFYSTEGIPAKEKIIYMHFFIGGCDWYVCEYEPESQLFFGFVVLNNDYEMAEWGYFSLKELYGLNVGFMEIDRDLHFPPTKAKEIEKIRKAQGWN